MCIPPVKGLTSYQFQDNSGPPGDGDDNSSNDSKSGDCSSQHGQGHPQGPPSKNPDNPPEGPIVDPQGLDKPTLNEYYCHQDEWQMNPKINLSSLPSWDGKGLSVIDYLAEMAEYARLGEKM